MKNKQNDCLRASAFQITFPVAFISLLSLLALIAAPPAQSQMERKPASADPAEGTWMATGSLGTACQDHTATLLPSGNVLVAGGWNTRGYLRSAEVYDPAAGT